ncbi:fibronectin type III domain-containing protein [Parapedobacter deserti]|uniref:Fibronectin type III domain-containing protein n=1 Tax=Parapedobacter deserti TaxID=1912957 RepID=A0ABV7JNK5_9SPHI
MNRLRRLLHCSPMLTIAVLLFVACKSPMRNRSVAETMDGIVTRLYAQYNAERLDTIGEEFILNFINQEEREALATNYWQFHVNVPVVVSIMRDTAQKTVPFWLEPAGFKKTKMEVSNGRYRYEVWQKRYSAGEVKLGINGFDKHRPVYFVSVAPQDANAHLTIDPIYPVMQHIDSLDVGAFTYHDWDGLKLTEVPEALRGQLLLTTIRGRAREAHLINAFRKTAFPAGGVADQITLTLSDDPATQMAVQWRTDTTIKNARIAYWRDGLTDTAMRHAGVQRLADRLLINDRYNQRFMAKLTGLSPNCTYRYQIYSESGAISDVFQFKTAPLADTFSFHWFGDIHNDVEAGKLIQLAYAQDSAAAFNLCSGDLVNTGLHRDDWDRLFHVVGEVFAKQPLMAVPGNHDSQDGLGASLFRSLLDYPANGPKGMLAGLSYSFNYKNALFIMIDAASFPVSEQTLWLAETLASSPAAWKFVVLHFPPYNEKEPYAEIVSQWVPVFEKNRVDMVLAGHFHYYMRTMPLKAGNPDADGVTYLMSVATAAGREADEPQPFVAKRIENGNFYQHFRIEGNRLTYTCFDAAGLEMDKLVVNK